MAIAFLVVGAAMYKFWRKYMYQQKAPQAGGGSIAPTPAPVDRVPAPDAVEYVKEGRYKGWRIYTPEECEAAGGYYEHKEFVGMCAANPETNRGGKSLSWLNRQL